MNTTTRNLQQYLTPEQFKSYCEGEFRDSLAILDINLKNPNKLNQAAARALGWSSYEALQSMQERQVAIRDGIAIMRCPYQMDRLTLKMKNIVMVFDGEFGEFYIKALSRGQEAMALHRANSLAIDALGDNKKLPALISCELDKDDGWGSTRATLKTSFFTVLINRTHEGVILDVFNADDTDFEDIVDTAGIMFCDNAMYEGEEDGVDLFSPAENVKLLGVAGECYQWANLSHDEDVYGEERHLLGKFCDGDGVDLSELVFSTPEEAEDVLMSGDFGSMEDVTDQGGVLVKVTRTLYRTNIYV